MKTVVRLVLQLAAQSIGKSWITSIGGYVGIAAAAFVYMGAVLDGNTVPDLEPVLVALGAAGLITYEKKPKEVPNEKPA